MAPRLGKTTPQNPTGAGARPAKPGDNFEQLRKAREAEEAHFLKFLAQLRPLNAQIAEAKAVMDGFKEEKKNVLLLAKAAGFDSKYLNEILADGGTSVKNLAEAEAKRARYREYAGLPVGVQTHLADKTPDAAKDEMDWEADGYRAGIRADEPKPPKECPPRFTQGWMKGYHNGQARNAWALTAAEPVTEPAPDPTPDVIEEDDPQPITTGPKGLDLAEKVFAKPEGGEVDAAADTTATSEDGFTEASLEELAGQITRQQVVGDPDEDEEEEPTVN